MTVEPIHVRFELSVNERENAIRAALAEKYPALYVGRFSQRDLLMAGGSVFLGVGLLELLAGPGYIKLNGVICTLLGIAWLGSTILTTIWTRRSVSQRADLTFAERITGTIDGTPVDLAWSEIAGAKLAGDWIGVTFRQNTSGKSGVSVPKSACEEGWGQLWALLDDRLTGERGLVRAPGLRTTIANTAVR